MALLQRSRKSRSSNYLKQTLKSISSLWEIDGGQQFLRTLYGFHDLCHKIPVSNGERGNHSSLILGNTKYRRDGEPDVSEQDWHKIQNSEDWRKSFSEI